MASTGPEVQPKIIQGVFTEHDLEARMFAMEVNSTGVENTPLKGGGFVNYSAGNMTKEHVSDEEDGFDEDDEEEDRNYRSKYENLKYDFDQLEERNKNIIRSYRDIKIDLKNVKEENARLEENHIDDRHLLENLKRELEKSEREKEKLRLEMHRIKTNQEYFKSQMAFVQANKYIRLLEFFESSGMLPGCQEIRNCKFIHENFLEAVRESLKIMSVNLDKDSSFEFNLPEGLSEVTLLKLENDLKGRIKKGGAAAFPSTFAQCFQPEFHAPFKNENLFLENIYRPEATYRPINHKELVETTQYATSNLPVLHSNFPEKNFSMNAKLDGSVLPVVGLPVHLPPPNLPDFSKPPPPLQGIDAAKQSMQPEVISGAMFFANIQTKQLNSKPTPLTNEVSGDSIHSRVLEEGKKRWPFMTEGEILEGLDKLRERKVKSGDIKLLLLLLDNLFEEEHGTNSSTKEKDQNDDTAKCPICFDPIDISDLHKTQCGHHFHSSCLNEWLERKRECPCCRQLVLLHDEFPSLWTTTRRKR